jgi:hypothetical protein
LSTKAVLLINSNIFQNPETIVTFSIITSIALLLVGLILFFIPLFERAKRRKKKAERLPVKLEVLSGELDSDRPSYFLSKELTTGRSSDISSDDMEVSGDSRIFKKDESIYIEDSSR